MAASATARRESGSPGPARPDALATRQARYTRDPPGQTHNFGSERNCAARIWLPEALCIVGSLGFLRTYDACVRALYSTLGRPAAGRAPSEYGPVRPGRADTLRFERCVAHLVSEVPTTAAITT